MKHGIGLLAGLAALGCGQPLFAQGSGSRAASADAAPRRVTAVIDYTQPDVPGQIQRFASRLGGQGAIVHLDLRIVPADESPPNYRVNEQGADGSTRPLSCEGGDRRSGSAYSFEFNPDYNHLLLTIRHGDWTRAPFSTAACVTNGTTGNTDFVISGYYWTSVLPIPTAVDVELRPLAALPRR